MLAFVFALSGSTAQAHSDLLSSDPGANSSVSELPNEITLTFSEPLLELGGAVGANQIVATMTGNIRLENGDVKILGNQVSVALRPTSERGQVTVGYRVVSADGHPIEGGFKFWIGERVHATPLSSEAATSQDVQAPWIWIAIAVPALALVSLLLLKRKPKGTD